MAPASFALARGLCLPWLVPQLVLQFVPQLVLRLVLDRMFPDAWDDQAWDDQAQDDQVRHASTLTSVGCSGRRRRTISCKDDIAQRNT